jgi:hypothetical protein
MERLGNLTPHIERASIFSTSSTMGKAAFAAYSGIGIGRRNGQRTAESFARFPVCIFLSDPSADFDFLITAEHLISPFHDL